VIIMSRKILCSSVILLMALAYAGLAHAETVADDSNDVWHWKWNGTLGTYSWEQAVTSHPNIDIKELSYTVNGQQVILEMTVYGTIENSDNIWYYAYYNTTDASYWMWYSNGSGMYMATSGTGGAYGNVTASGDTITATVNAVGTGAKQEFWGYSAEWTGNDKTGEYWGDWAPQDTSPWYGTDGGDGGDGGEDGTDGGGGGIPGFEVAMFAGAVALALIMRRRIPRS